MLDMEVSAIYLLVVTCLSFLACFVIQEFIGPFVSARVYNGYRVLPAQAKAEWDSRVCSFFNGVFMVGVVTYIFIFETDAFFIHRNESASIKLAICVGLGYYFADTLFMIRHSIEEDTSLYFIHHIVVIVSCLYRLILNVPTGDYYLYIRMTAEYSAPCYNIRWFLWRCSMGNSLPDIINSVVLVVTFTVFRILIIPFYHYTAYQDYMTGLVTSDVVCCGVCLGAFIDAANIWWFTAVISELRRLIGEKKDN